MGTTNNTTNTTTPAETPDDTKNDIPEVIYDENDPNAADIYCEDPDDPECEDEDDYDYDEYDGINFDDYFDQLGYKNIPQNDKKQVRRNVIRQLISLNLLKNVRRRRKVKKAVETK